MRRWWIAGALAVTTVVALEAQTTKPTFEVASVKKRESAVFQGFPPRSVRDHGIFTSVAETVTTLVQFAYNIRADLIVDGPAWARTDLFEVNARAGADVPSDQIRLMVQSLLDERFKLVIRREPREMQHFVMVVARNDGRLGPAIRQVEDCTSARASRPKPPPVPTGAVQMSGCGAISALAERVVSDWMRVPVIDSTGLTGTFDYFFYSSNDGWRLAGRNPDAPQADPNLPPFREALLEQMGFRLESKRGPLDVLVIDSVQQPTEN